MTDVALQPGQTPVAHASLEARANFISRTYSHLLGGILLFALACTAMIQFGVAERIVNWLGGTKFGWLGLLGGFMVAGWLGSRVAATAVSKPKQYLGFGLILAAHALLFAPLLYIAATYFPGVITKAGVATLVGFSGLTAIAFTTRKDFSFLGGILKWAMFCALGLIVASVLIGFNLGLVFAVAMVALAGAAILYDTSNVIHHYPEDRYVAASLALFSSVALMFWYMIQIFLSFED